MRPTPRTTARAALMALLALAVLLTAGCAIPAAEAQQGPYPYPAQTGQATAAPTTGATVAPTTGGTAAPTTGATVAPTTGATVAPTTGGTAAPTTGATVAPTTAAPRPTVAPTPRPSTGLPNTSGGAFPLLFGISLLALAGAVALARRRLS